LVLYSLYLYKREINMVTASINRGVHKYPNE
jgi:hypothetical protein